MKDILPFLELNGQFDKLTDRTERTPVPELNGQFGKLTDLSKGTPVPELAEGALYKQYIYTVANASGSELCVCLFRVSASVFSV